MATTGTVRVNLVIDTRRATYHLRMLSEAFRRFSPKCIIPTPYELRNGLATTEIRRRRWAQKKLANARASNLNPIVVTDASGTTRVVVR